MKLIDRKTNYKMNKKERKEERKKERKKKKHIRTNRRYERQVQKNIKNLEQKSGQMFRGILSSLLCELFATFKKRKKKLSELD